MLGLILTAFLPVTLGQEMFLGACPDVSPVTDFNITKVSFAVIYNVRVLSVHQQRNWTYILLFKSISIR